MSTKIGHGRRLAADTDPFLFTERVREVMDPIRDVLDAILFAELAVTSVDSADFRSEPRPSYPALDAFMKWDAEQSKIKRSDRRFDPHSFTVAFGLDPVTGRHLVLPLTDRREFRDAFDNMDEVEDYSYQNWTDQPGEVSEEEWNERRGAWDRVLGYDAPAERMLSWDLRSAYHPGTMMVLAERDGRYPLLEHAPSLESRARRIAQNAYSVWLHKEKSVEVMQAVSVSFRTDLARLIEVIEPALAPVTAALFQKGTGESRLAEIKDSLPALCAAIHSDTEED